MKTNATEISIESKDDSIVQLMTNVLTEMFVSSEIRFDVLMFDYRDLSKIDYPVEQILY